MTYCLSLLCRQGVVFLSDSRTSAGVDNITIHSKMRLYQDDGTRVICLMTSGNLSLTQTVVALIDEDMLRGKAERDVPHLLNQPTMYETARYVGSKIRQVEKLDRVALEADGFSFNIHVVVGGQIAGMPHEIYHVYPQGNAIHADTDSPFLQIGEFKYGKPILDRGFTYDTHLADAVKFGVLSLESTMKSNVSVGTPFDIFCYERDSFAVKYRLRLEDGDSYLSDVQKKWQNGIVELVAKIPRLQFPHVDRQPGEPA
ncbi:MAG: putative proteasome-type protease [Chthoniobacter sp.]|jgi:putative proteasome-type protease|nr:putative proteasome-type protease [Chthoniobacter sp.]